MHGTFGTTPDVGERVKQQAAEHLARRAGLFPGDTALACPAGDGLAAVAIARAEDQWERPKICPADDCQWAFYDHSKNRSRNWCSMRVCGNRTKAEEYRKRKTAQPSS